MSLKLCSKVSQIGFICRLRVCQFLSFLSQVALESCQIPGATRWQLIGFAPRSISKPDTAVRLRPSSDCLIEYVAADSTIVRTLPYDQTETSSSVHNDPVSRPLSSFIKFTAKRPIIGGQKQHRSAPKIVMPRPACYSSNHGAVDL
jgi:hypothetical protein